MSDVRTPKPQRRSGNELATPCEGWSSFRSPAASSRSFRTCPIARSSSGLTGSSTESRARPCGSSQHGTAHNCRRSHEYRSASQRRLRRGDDTRRGPRATLAASTADRPTASGSRERAPGPSSDRPTGGEHHRFRPHLPPARLRSRIWWRGSTNGSAPTGASTSSVTTATAAASRSWRVGKRPSAS